MAWWCGGIPNTAIVAILSGFAPWIVHWVLAGNVPFTVAVLEALAIAVLPFVIGRVKDEPGRTLEFGTIVVGGR